jgi:hypothetical protein
MRGIAGGRLAGVSGGTAGGARLCGPGRLRADTTSGAGLVGEADAGRAWGWPPLAGGGAEPAGPATLTVASDCRRPSARRALGRDGAAARCGAGRSRRAHRFWRLSNGMGARRGASGSLASPGDGAAARRGRGVAGWHAVVRPLRRHSVVGDRPMNEPLTARTVGDRRVIEPRRRHHGGSRAVPAGALPAALGDPEPAGLSGRDPCWGRRGAAVAPYVQRRRPALALDRGRDRLRLGGVGARAARTP